MWLRDVTNIDRTLNTTFNNIVLTNKNGLQKMNDHFADIFGEAVDYSDQIASIYFMPLQQITTDDTIGYLSAKKVIEYTDVKSKNVKGANLQNLGEFFVSPRFNSFADLKGYTYIKIYLPFLGFVDVDINECMGKYLQFICLFNFHRGTCTYIIGVTPTSVNYINPIITSSILNERYNNCRVISTFEAEVGYQIPVGRSSLGDLQRNAILGTVKFAASAITFLATEGAALPSTTQTTQKTYSVTARSLEKGSRMKPVLNGEENTISTRTYDKPYSTTRNLSEVVDSGLDALNRFVPNSSTDRINSSYGLFGLSEKVIVCIYRPRIMNNTDDYNFLVGRPVGIATKLSEVSGYTEISSIHLEGEHFAKATKDELREIEATILSSDGIILPGDKKVLNTFKVEDRNDVVYNYNFIYPTDWDTFINSPYNINKRFVLEKDLYPELSPTSTTVYFIGESVTAPLKDFSGSLVSNNNSIMSSTYSI